MAPVAGPDCHISANFRTAVACLGLLGGMHVLPAPLHAQACPMSYETSTGNSALGLWCQSTCMAVQTD